MSRRVSRSSMRRNPATCTGSRQGHGMEVADFVRSAEVSAAPIARKRRARRRARTRRRRRRPSRRSVRTPISASCFCALRSRRLPEVADAPLRPALAGVLDRLDKADARDVFAAIAAANPGGLGRAARHDVRAPAARRRCAKPWRRRRSATASRASTSRPTRTFSPSACRRSATARQRRSDAPWATLAVYLTFLADIPDTHIARKFDARRRRGGPPGGGRLARCVHGGGRSGARLADSLPTWDGALKSRGINPGTSADLTVATLFAASLSAIRRDNCAPDILPLRATMLELAVRGGARPATIRPTDPAEAGC